MKTLSLENKVNSCFSKLQDTCIGNTWFDKTFEIVLAEAKSDIKNNKTIVPSNPKLRAKMMIIINVFELLADTQIKVDGEDFFRYSQGYFACYATARAYDSEIRKDFNLPELRILVDEINDLIWKFTVSPTHK